MTRTEPATMAAPTEGTKVSDTSLIINWAALTGSSDTGNSPITAYSLYWNAGSGTTFTQLFEGIATTYTASGLTSGTNYKFKVRAKNIYGYGPFSPEAEFSASTVPSLPASVTTAYDTYPNIDITWTAPSSGGLSITKY